MERGIDFAQNDSLDDLIDKLRQHRREQFFVEEQFRAAFFNTSRAMCIVALDGRFLEINDAACRLWLRSRQELLGMTWMSLTHEDDLEEDLSQVEALVSGQTETYGLPKRYLLPNGGVIRAHLEVTIVKDELRYPKYMISRIYSERTLQQMLEDVKEKAV